MRLLRSTVLGLASASHIKWCTFYGDTGGQADLPDEVDEPGFSELTEVTYAFDDDENRGVFRVFSNEATGSFWQRWVAQIAAKLLDQDEDGIPDDAAVAKCLRDNRAHIALLELGSLEDNYSDNLSAAWQTGRVEPINDRNMHVSFDHRWDWMREAPNAPGQSDDKRVAWDVSFQQVTAVINQVGYACAYPHIFGENDSMLASAYDQATAAHT